MNEENSNQAPLVVVDLLRHVRDYADAVVNSHHKHTAANRPLRVASLGSDWDKEFSGAAGIQVTGSPDMLEDVAWAAKLCDALEQAATDGIPVLGVCFGHQMLGVHFGATMASWNQPKVGVNAVSFADDGPFQKDTIPILLTHRDYLTDLGTTLEACGSGGYGGVQAWRHPRLPIWGVQGHPEADAALTRTAEGKDVEHFSDEELATPAAKGILRRFGQLMDARDS